MVSTLNKDGGLRRKRVMGPFKGVRMRKWGRWVSEIRIPQSKTRIWLGSYDAPEKAARAYDAALYCLRGKKGTFNFPDEKRPEIPDESSTPLSKEEIQAVAARFAISNCMSDPSSESSFVTFNNSQELPVMDDGAEATCKADESLYIAGESGESDMFWPESFLLDEPLMLEPDSLWAILDETKHFGEDLM